MYFIHETNWICLEWRCYCFNLNIEHQNVFISNHHYMSEPTVDYAWIFRHKTDMDNSRSVQWKLRTMTYFIIFSQIWWIIINIVIGLPMNMFYLNIMRWSILYINIHNSAFRILPHILISVLPLKILISWAISVIVLGFVGLFT